MRLAERAAQFGAGLEDGFDGGAAWALLERARRDAAAGRRPNGQSVILAGLAAPEFDPPACAVDAAVAGIGSARSGAPSAAGTSALRAAVAEIFDAAAEPLRPKVRWRADNVVITPGAQGALYAALQVLIDDGDEVVAPSPASSAQAAAVAAAGGIWRPAPLSPDRGFALEARAVEAAITPRTRALLLTSPHHPTGAALDPTEMAAIAELAEACDLWVISDESYGRLAFDAPHLSIAAAPGMATRTVVLDSVAHGFEMGGWRIGWLIGPRDVARRIEGLLRATFRGAPGFAQAGALAALTEGGLSAERARAAYRRRRDLMGRVLAASSRARPSLGRASGRGAALVRLVAPSGGPGALIDARGLADRFGIEPGDLAEAIYEETGAAMVGGLAFGPEAAGFLGASLTLDEERLADLTARIARLAAL